MFCKFCGEKIEESALFCPNCGQKQTVDETDFDVDVTNNRIVSDEGKFIHDKKKKILQKCYFGSLIAGIIGISIFLGIVLVGLFAYGKVYLFDGYAFTVVLSVISIVLMMIGLCGIIAKFVLYRVFKIGEFPASTAKKVIVVGLAVACMGFSIWGGADCGNSRASVSGSGWSFYTVYYECGCNYPWADCGADYLSIDTNPYNYDSDSYSATTYASVALSAIRSVNSKLGLPSYLYDEMLETRALDGRQSYSGTKVSVTWRYHPDTGLEVRYTKNN